MASATNAGMTTNYLYNALGQRVKKSNTTGTTYFVYDEAGHLAGEYDQSGTMIQGIVWLGDIQVATIRTDQGGSGAGVFYIHTDHLNSPTKITRSTDNQVIWRWDHDPYGNGTPNQDPDGNGLSLAMNLRYPGQYFDQETGLLYNYYRDYDPSTGRYVESDPIGLDGGSFSTYAYVNDNPVMLVDEDGLMGHAPGSGGSSATSPSQVMRNIYDEIRRSLPDYDKAKQIAREELQKHHGHNDADDARRHAEWSCRMESEIGPFTAWSSGTGHELDNLFNGGPWRESLMDLHNNAEGRDAARQGRPIIPTNLRTDPTQSAGPY